MTTKPKKDLAEGPVKGIKVKLRLKAPEENLSHFPENPDSMIGWTIFGDLSICCFPHIKSITHI
jgi:hypothetical protein